MKKGKTTKKAPRHPTGRPDTSADLFAQLVEQFKPAGAGVFPLKNFTFFLGAGFSKAWADTYPIGSQIFHVPARDRISLGNVERAAHCSGIHAKGDLDVSAIKQIIYTLDMNRRYPAIRSRYLDDQNITAVKKELSAFFCNRFKSGRDWCSLSTKSFKFHFARPFSSAQERIRLLFSRMFDLIDGSEGRMEGVRFNFITTNYDWLVEAIIDSVSWRDESSLLYLYRGVTPQDISGLRNDFVAHDHNLVFNLFKINGGFEIFGDGPCYHFDYTSKTKDELTVRPPILMLPSREQDYLSDYFTAVFPKAVRLLNETKVLILVGYSLPQEDALLRFIIRQFCEDVADAAGKYIFYVDRASEAEMYTRLRSVFPFAGRILPASVYSGDFSEWAGNVAAAIG